MQAGSSDTPSRLARRRRRVVAWAALAALALAGAAATLFVARPLAVFEWLGRAGLRSGGFERRQVAAPRGRLTFFRAGQGPTLLLLHGANDQAGAWYRIAPALARERRVLIPDLPGHGESAPAAGPLAVTDLLAGVDAVLAAEAPGERVTVVGNSLGGFLALLLAERHPERVAHVVLVNGAAVTTGGGQVELLPKTRDEARAALAKLTAPGAPAPPGFVLDDLVRRGPGSPLARLLQSPVAELALDGRLAEIRTPVSLIWGEADQLLPASYARALQAQLPLARLTPLPACGHIPQRECPERFLAALEAALAQPPALPAEEE